MARLPHHYALISPTRTFSCGTFAYQYQHRDHHHYLRQSRHHVPRISSSSPRSSRSVYTDTQKSPKTNTYFKMASNPMGKCCYQGVKHEGTTTGTYETIGDFEAYVKYPEDKNYEKGVLIITDVIGHRISNAQLIADQLAANGYFVLMPDLFYGDPISMNRPDDFDIQKWLKGEYNEEKKSHLPPIVDPIIELCIKEMRGKYNCKKIGAIGYCFGGKYVVRFLKPSAGLLDAGYTAHPSFVDVAELEAMTGPLSIAAAETDSIFPEDKRHETEVVLKKSGLPYQVNLYSGVEHGFAVRGDPTKAQSRYAKEMAFVQALQWFEEHLQ